MSPNDHFYCLGKTMTMGNGKKGKKNKKRKFSMTSFNGYQIYVVNILTCMPFNPNVIKLDRLLSNAIFSAMKHTLLNSWGTSLCMPCCLYSLSKS